MSEAKKKYAIIRVQKLKSGDLAGVDNHNLRLGVLTENIDAEKSHLNRFYLGTAKPLNQLIHDRLLSAGVTRKVRPDAVLGLEFLLTASPEFFDEDMRKGDSAKLTKWIDDSMDYMANLIGKENIVQVVLHMDEATPHLQVVAVPISIEGTTAKLNAKPWTELGKWRRMWTSYATAMKSHGLQRGEMDANAEHQTLKAGRKEVIHIAEKAVSLASAAVDTSQRSETHLHETLVKQNFSILRNEKKIDEASKKIDLLVVHQEAVIKDQASMIATLKNELYTAYETIKRLLGKAGTATPAKTAVEPLNQATLDVLGGTFDM